MDELFDTREYDEAQILGLSPHSFSSTKGAASEMLAAGKLLLAGHRVAVPIADEDRVDLVVDYAITVQVKSATKRTGINYNFAVNARKRNFNSPNTRPRRSKPFADIFLFHAQPIDSWWVIPSAELMRLGRWQSGTITLPSFHQDIECWREQWNLFDDQLSRERFDDSGGQTPGMNVGPIPPI